MQEKDLEGWWFAWGWDVGLDRVGIGRFLDCL